MTDRKKPGVAFWATVGLVVVLVGYPLSVGPLILIVRLEWLPESALAFAVPVDWVIHNGPLWLGCPSRSTLVCGADTNSRLTSPSQTFPQSRHSGTLPLFAAPLAGKSK